MRAALRGTYSGRKGLQVVVRYSRSEAGGGYTGNAALDGRRMMLGLPREGLNRQELARVGA